MSTVLNLHYIVGLLAVLASLALVWQRPGRRITLYVLTLQILLGIGLYASGLRVPAVHWILALVAWGGYMAANVIGKKAEKVMLARVIAGVSTLLVLGAFGIGQHAVHHPT